MFPKLAPALVAPLLLLGACAKEADGTRVLTGDAAVAALRAAPDAAAEAGSGRFEMTMSFDTPEGSFEIVATGGFTGTQMTMEMDLGAAFADMAAVSGEPVPPGLDEPVLMVSDGTAMYLRFPMYDSFTGGEKWLSMDFEELGIASETLGLGAGGSNPAQMLEALRGVADDLEPIGEDEIRGVPVAGYAATIDMAKAIEQAPAATRDMLEAAFEGADAAGIRFPVEIWIDGEGLPRRMVVDLSDVMAATGAGSGSASVATDFFDYGTPVDVQIPDASDTVPFTDVLGDLGAPEGLG